MSFKALLPNEIKTKLDIKNIKRKKIGLTAECSALSSSKSSSSSSDESEIDGDLSFGKTALEFTTDFCCWWIDIIYRFALLFTTILKYFLGILQSLLHVKMRKLVHIFAKIRHVSGITVTMILGKPRIYVNGGSEIAQKAERESMVVRAVVPWSPIFLVLNYLWRFFHIPLVQLRKLLWGKKLNNFCTVMAHHILFWIINGEIKKCEVGRNVPFSIQLVFSPIKKGRMLERLTFKCTRKRALKWKLSAESVNSLFCKR